MGENVLTRKIGPLPGWAYAAIAAGGIFLLRRGSSSSSTDTTGSSIPTVATDSSGSTGGADNTGAGGMPYGADFSNITNALATTNATLAAINKKLPAGTPAKPAVKRPAMPKTSPGKGYSWIYRAYDNKWHKVKNPAPVPAPKGRAGGPSNPKAV